MVAVCQGLRRPDGVTRVKQVKSCDQRMELKEFQDKLDLIARDQIKHYQKII
jgi:hypothetical protein